MDIQSYQDLVVYQKSVAASVEAGKIAKMLPTNEQFELSSQMRRAADSVPSNIAEGYGQGSRKAYINFLYIANGSNNELQTQLLLCVKHGYVSKEAAKYALSLTYEVGRMLKRLIAALKEVKVD